uniref:Rho termination factor N-terminal domain-containing protein n=1 Tax=viral metagenome TaxID=1070528 RepID=A0A6C0L9W1_9ZZZZ
MALLNDTVTVAILLIMVFGSTTFYLYTRLVQNEKRVALLENLLLSLKMSTEASFMGADMFRSGPDSVQPVSSPSPLKEDDVDVIDEEKYAEMLKEIPSDGLASASASATATANAGKSVDVNYEAMTLKELQATGRQNGVAVHGLKKKEIIDSLKKKLGGEELEGADLSVHGFTVNLEEVPKKEE